MITNKLESEQGVLKPSKEKPLIEYWIELFEKYDVVNVRNNTSQVYNFFDQYEGPLTFIREYESVKSGTLSTVLINHKLWINSK